MERVFIGIDPGKNGGMAWIIDREVTAITMPSLDEKVSFPSELVKGNVICILEQVHASPQMGVSSAFNFGMHYGFLKAWCLSMFKEVVHVTPQKWQAALNCRTGGDKKVSLKKAKELFPDVHVTLKTADALLLAYYGYMKYGK